MFGNNLLGLPSPGRGYGPNLTARAGHFPLHKLTDKDQIGEPLQNPSNVVRDVNDLMGLMGVVLMAFVAIVPGSPVDLGIPVADDVFSLNNTNKRRVMNRNTPPVINAVFNFTQFWAGRAINIFNGKNPFGSADPTPHVIVNVNGSGLQTTPLYLRQSVLASQAVSPPLSDVEMSWRGRSWPKIGKKMLSLKPLGQQRVHPSDSVFGPLADNSAGVGLTSSYAKMIKQAFRAKFWKNTTQKVVYDVDGFPAFVLGNPENTVRFVRVTAFDAADQKIGFDLSDGPFVIQPAAVP